MAKGRTSLESDGSWPKPRPADEPDHPRMPVGEFVIASANDKDHFTRVRVPQDGLAVKMIGMIKGGLFPQYRGNDLSFVRDALHHRAFDLFHAHPEAFEPELGEFLAYEKAKAAHAALVAATERQQDFCRMLDDIYEKVDSFAPVEVRRQVAIIAAQIPKLAPHRQGELRDRMDRINKKLAGILDDEDEL